MRLFPAAPSRAAAPAAAAAAAASPRSRATASRLGALGLPRRSASASLLAFPLRAATSLSRSTIFSTNSRANSRSASSKCAFSISTRSFLSPALGTPSTSHARRRSATLSRRSAAAESSAETCLAMVARSLLRSICRFRALYTRGVTPGREPGRGSSEETSPFAVAASQARVISARAASRAIRDVCASAASRAARTASAPTARGAYGAFLRPASCASRFAVCAFFSSDLRVRATSSSASAIAASLASSSRSDARTRASSGSNSNSTIFARSSTETPGCLPPRPEVTASSFGRRALFSATRRSLAPMASASRGLSLAISSSGSGQLMDDRTVTPA